MASRVFGQSSDRRAFTPSKVFNLRVLIVDDHRTMRQIVRRFLSQFGVDDVIEAENGLNAIDILVRVDGAAPPDVIICDLHMDKMDGMEFVSLIRRRRVRVNAHTPILMLTGEPDRFVLDVVEQVGATKILKKPITAAELADEIGRVVGLKI